MQKLLVYTQEGHALIGTGWVIHHGSKTYEPTLIALDGTELPQGWYTIKVSDEGFLIVINKTVQ